jgi:hypothetical protein
VGYRSKKRARGGILGRKRWKNERKRTIFDDFKVKKIKMSKKRAKKKSKKKSKKEQKKKIRRIHVEKGL